MLKSFDGQLNNEQEGTNKEKKDATGAIQNKRDEGAKVASSNNQLGLINESDSIASGSAMSHRGYDSHRGMIDKDNY